MMPYDYCFTFYHTKQGVDPTTGEMVYPGPELARDTVFHCPDCDRDLVHCTPYMDNRWHYFRHFPDCESNPTPESELHKTCKKEISEAILVLPYKTTAILEMPIKSSLENCQGHRPDICGRINEQPYAIEVQQGGIPPTEIVRRAKFWESYKEKPALLWVIPLPKPFFELFGDRRLYGNEGTVQLNARRHERVLSAFHIHRLYFWWPGLGLNFFPVRIEVASKEVPETEYYSEGGVLEHRGGYEKQLKRLFNYFYVGKMVSFPDDFSIEAVGSVKVRNMSTTVLPERKIWRDTISATFYR